MYLKKIILISIVLFSLLGLSFINQFFLFNHPVNAANTADFSAGNIMSDEVFTDKNSMSINQIQSFLQSKNSVCLVNFTSLSLNDSNGDGLGDEPYGKGTGETVSAAKLIWQAAQLYGISPRVILSTLQKEQGLITRTDCPSWRYSTALGYGCPDTAPCDQSAYGFTRQIDYGVWHFKGFFHDTYPVPPTTPGNKAISYNPDASCGSKVINIQNRATAALYSYTPYQPNNATLAAAQGQTVTCGAYGNLNFWRYFTDWFGSTQAPRYESQFVTQSNYPTINPGQSTTIFIQIKNTGNQTWYDDVTAGSNGVKPIHLATADPINRQSIFANSSWGAGGNRPTTLFSSVFDSSGVELSTNPHAVKPGESARFSFTLTTPPQYSPGQYKESFVLIEEGGYGPIPPLTPWFNINVPKYLASEYTSKSADLTLRPGETITSNYIVYKNTGNTNWYDDTNAIQNNAHPIRLATMNPVNRASKFADTSWGAYQNRPTGLFESIYKPNGDAYSNNPHVVRPGESVKFKFNLTAPDNNTPGSYSESYGLVEEGGAGIINSNSTTSFNITSTDVPTAKPVTLSSTLDIPQKNSATKTYQFKNTGTTTWPSNTQLMLVAGSSDSIKSSSWTSSTFAANINEASVAPGDIGSFTVTYTASGALGTYSLKFSPSINNQPISLTNQSVNITVTKPDYTASFYSQSEYPSIRQNSSQLSTFRFKNVGNVPWYDASSASTFGVNPVVLATTDPINRKSIFNAGFSSPDRPTTVFSKVYQSDGVTLSSDQHKANPGEIAEFSVVLTARVNTPTGTYREYFQPIVEGGDPWSMKQTVWLNVNVTESLNVAKYYDQSPYPTVNRGSSSSAHFRFVNTGNVPWYDAASATSGISPITLAATDPINRLSAFNSSFTTASRPSIQFSAVYEADGVSLSSNQHVVKPGQIAKFSFTLTAPSNLPSGTYQEYFQPIVEGGNLWSMQQIVWLNVKVN